MQILKKFLLILWMILGANEILIAQKDSVVVTKKEDTIKIGGVIILKESDRSGKKRVVVSIYDQYRIAQRNRKVTTSYFFFDFGFSNWNDKTDYSSATANHSIVNRPETSLIGKKDFDVRAGKSVNFNVWILGQKISLINKYVNFKYALGVQLNNYSFSHNITFNDGGVVPYNPGLDVNHAFVFRDSIDFKKNKLAADYFTVPMMLNFNTNPYGTMRLDISAGISIGYLYSARNKQVSTERGKAKNQGNYDIRKWKFSYEADVSLFKLLHLYGSYTPQSIFRNDLNFRPYTIGARYSPKW